MAIISLWCNTTFAIHAYLLLHQMYLDVNQLCPKHPTLSADWGYQNREEWNVKGVRIPLALRTYRITLIFFAETDSTAFPFHKTRK